MADDRAQSISVCVCVHSSGLWLQPRLLHGINRFSLDCSVSCLLGFSSRDFLSSFPSRRSPNLILCAPTHATSSSHRASEPTSDNALCSHAQSCRTMNAG
ncbi:hypothetical protein KP509_29G072600 [Ceratopteris richardii]|uniref:Uncharacterized protein n=1 Tax=Ceratopteris richardii TaxID=49495 RepID=A0A8T2R828_CERRI|nr:hypothetical protein KP509_29G072600 [Ceratopteris richardii]